MRRFQFNDLSFEAPAEWMDLSVITLAGRDSASFAPNLVITREDAPKGSLERYAKRQVKDIKRQVSGHRLLSAKAKQLAGTEAYVLEHQLVTPDKQQVHQLQYFVKSDGDVIIMSLTCDAAELRARRSMLDRIAESFRLER